MRLFDLHTHTKYSDGLLTPGELVRKASAIGLSGISITDHDSIDGIPEAIAESKMINDFEVVPGIELSCVEGDEEIHILGYFIDYQSTQLKNALIQIIDERWIRGEKILKKLELLGIKLPIEAIIEEARKSGFIGRATIARNLIDFGYVRSIPEAFYLYLDKDRPAYVERFELRVKEAIELIHSIGGISVLAHPGLLLKRETVTFCIEKGIMGIECFHTKHSKEDTEFFAKLCIMNDLLQTGGSDFHGDDEILGVVSIDLDHLPQFKERLF